MGDCESLFFTELSHFLQGHETVLDIGVGTGRFSLAIAQRVTTGKVLCLDVSAHSARLYKGPRRGGFRTRFTPYGAKHLFLGYEATPWIW